MNRATAGLLLIALAACRRTPSPATPTSAAGATIVGVSGEKQVAGVGANLEQPIVVQVNDAQSNGVAGALVQFSGPGGVRFDPASGLTGTDGQISAAVRLGSTAGKYVLTATTRDKTGKTHQATLSEIALDYRETVGREVSEKYCSRCHDPESTAEQVSNHDNLSAAPHPFSDGAALNQMSDVNLMAIIEHGGAALGRSPEMPPYSPTLSTTDIEAVRAYIRAVADPPYRRSGVFYANK